MIIRTTLTWILFTLAFTFYGGYGNSIALASAGVITGTEARDIIQKTGAILIDVRTPEEHRQKHIPGALLFPVQSIATDLYHLGDFNRPIIVYCRSGRRAAQAIEILKNAGFKDLYNLGTVENWEL